MALIAILALTACHAGGAVQPGHTAAQPVPAFGTSSATPGREHRDESLPLRIRRDGYGRPIHFHEVPMDPHRAAACGDEGCEPDVKRERRDDDE